MIEVFCIDQTESQSVKQKYFNVKKFIYFLIVFNTFEYMNILTKTIIIYIFFNSFNTFEYMNILTKNDYNFYIDTRTLEDFNGEKYKKPEELTENLMSNKDLYTTLLAFHSSLYSMNKTYEVKMSMFKIELFLERINEYKGY